MTTPPTGLTRTLATCVAVAPAFVLAPGLAPRAAAETTPFEGAVYAMTNRFDGNTVAAFGKNPDGTLTPIAEFATGGNGAFFDGGEGLDPLISQDALFAVDNRHLLAVNAGSDSITSFRINPDFSLTVTDTASTGGVGPNSIAYHNGLLYASNTDSDGVFTGPPDQIGNITGFTFDADTGQLDPIAGSTRQLTNRPSDLRFSPDGGQLLISSWNAGSAAIAGPGSENVEEVVVYSVGTDGTLSSSAIATAASTLLNNAEGRNLPSAIGLTTQVRDGETIVLVTEARELNPDGSFDGLGAFQTGSLSSWRLEEDGSLTPLSQDVITGTQLDPGDGTAREGGQTSACWIDVTPDGTTIYVANASGGSISSYALNEDGTVTLISETAAQGAPADIGADAPLANADGFIDLVISEDGEYLYQLLGLQGTINVYEIDPDQGPLTLLQQTTGLLPGTNIQGIATVDGSVIIPTPSAALLGLALLPGLMLRRRR